MDVQSVVDLSRVRQLTRSGAARSVRIAAKLSLSDIGDAVGVTPSTVFRWENGQRAPRGEAALRYVALLDRLMGGGR
jgi:transcriptional regulator with XRE-family HTH domain